jgi:hypothetical protein
MAAASETPDDACKRDEERLGELQAKPSIKDVLSFADEFRCSKLQPQLLALLDSLGRAVQSEGAAGPNGAPPSPKSAGETTPPPSAPSAITAASAPPDDACKRDEDRLDRLRQNPSREEAARFAEELSCERLRPQLPALASDLAKPPSGSEGVSKDAAGTTTANETPPAAPAIAASPAPAPRTSPAAEAVAEADRRIASLERERDTLAAEVDRLEHHRDSAAPAQADPPASPQPAGPAERSGPEPDDAALASLPEGMSALVLIRYPRNNVDARRQAESLADALKRQDVEVADLRESDAAVRTGVSFFYARDAAIAQRIGGLVGIAPTRRPQMRDGLMARPGAIELSFSGDSHLAVIANSRKETIHE